jgi:hypothetical protein
MNNAHLAPIFREAAKKIAEHEENFITFLGRRGNKAQVTFADIVNPLYFDSREHRVLALLFAAEFVESENV